VVTLTYLPELFVDTMLDRQDKILIMKVTNQVILLRSGICIASVPLSIEPQRERR